MGAPWTFGHGGDLQQLLAWLTDIITPLSHMEQRRKLRLGPRQTLSWDALCEGNARRYLETLLWKYGGSEWEVPLPMFGVVLDASLAIGATSVPIDTNGRAFVAGGRALLVADDPERFELVTIAAVASDALTLAPGTTLAWTSGTRIYPVRTGRFTAVPTLPRFTSEATAFRVEFLLSEPLDFTGDLGGVTYRGKPVFERRPVWSSDPQYAALRQLTLVDEQTGPINYLDFPGIALPLQEMSFTIHGWDEVTAFFGELYALSGCFTGVWLPTWAADLQVTGVPATNQLDVEWAGLGDYHGGVNRTDIRIELRDGTVLRRRIDTVAAEGAGERITLDSDFGVAFHAVDVALVSFLWYGRLDADAALLRWWSSDVIDCDLAFRGVRHGL